MRGKSVGVLGGEYFWTEIGEGLDGVDDFFCDREAEIVAFPGIETRFWLDVLDSG